MQKTRRINREKQRENIGLFIIGCEVVAATIWLATFINW